MWRSGRRELGGKERGEGERGALGRWTKEEKEQEIQFSLYLYA